MPAPNTDGVPPDTVTPLYDERRTHPPPKTTNTMNREAHPHPSGHRTAANTATTTPPGDPNTWRWRSQDSSTTMTPTTRDLPAHRSRTVHPRRLSERLLQSRIGIPIVRFVGRSMGLGCASRGTCSMWSPPTRVCIGMWICH